MPPFTSSLDIKEKSAFPKHLESINDKVIRRQWAVLYTKLQSGIKFLLSCDSFVNYRKWV